MLPFMFGWTCNKRVTLGLPEHLHCAGVVQSSYVMLLILPQSREYCAARLWYLLQPETDRLLFNPAVHQESLHKLLCGTVILKAQLALAAPIGDLTLHCEANVEIRLSHTNMSVSVMQPRPLMAMHASAHRVSEQLADLHPNTGFSYKTEPHELAVAYGRAAFPKLCAILAEAEVQKQIKCLHVLLPMLRAQAS